MQVSGQGLAHSFKGTGLLFTDLSFTFLPGELVALTGPSGSGKSTLLSLLAGWEKPKAGKLQWDQVGTIGWVFQNPYGVAGRSAIDHVTLPYLAQGLSRKDAVDRALEILARFDLESVAHQRFSALSGGEAQRLMLARAVAKAPSLLLVDEPTAQLDLGAAKAVNAVLGELAMDNAIVVVATHDVDTRDSCHRAIDLRDFQSGLVQQ